MKEIKLTKNELERLFIKYSSTERKSEDERLVDVCRDLDHAEEKDLFEIYNTFCRYLRVDGLCVYRMSEFNSFEFANNVELKILTENVDLDDTYFIMDLYFAGGCICGFSSFSDLKSKLEYRIPFSLQQIKKCWSLHLTKKKKRKRVKKMIRNRIVKCWELQATCQKFFYRKAYVLQDESGNLYLQSYDTIVLWSAYSIALGREFI